jgi:hypothetical protein
VAGFGDGTSGWWFYGRLRPTSETRFNVQEIVVRRDVRLEVAHDVIAAWSKPGPNALSGPAEVRELFGVTLGAYALITGVALDWTLEGWIEATAAQFDGAMIGTFADFRGPSPMLSPRAPRSVDMRRACKLAISVHDRPSYRLALRDVHATLLIAGDDAFVFAYRALEDLARSVSGREGDLRSSDWSALHAHLGTTDTEFKQRIAPVQAARRAASHGDSADPNLARARSNRKAYLAISREVVADVLALEPDLPFTLNYFRS